MELAAFLREKLLIYESEYVDRCFENDFAMLDESPLSIVEEDVLDNLKLFHDLILDSNVSTCRELLKTFKEGDLSLRNLVVFLSSFIFCNDEQAGRSIMQQLVHIHSCSSYVLLLSMQDSGAYHLFSFNLIDRVLNTLNKLGTDYKPEAGVEDNTVEKNKRKKCIQTSKRKKKMKMDEDIFANELREEEADDEDGSVEVLAALKVLMTDMVCLLASASYASYHDDCIIDCLSSITCMDHLVGSSFNDFSSYNRSTECTLHHLSFIALYKLLTNQHMKDFKMNMFEKLCYKLLNNMTLKNYPSNIPYSGTVVLQMTVHLIRTLMMDLIECDQLMYIFIQHICASVPDKLDHRVKVSQSVALLLESLSQTHLEAFVTWLTDKLTKSAKISQRMFSVDLVSSMLECGSVPDVERSKNDLVESLLERCSDASPNVRTRALLCLHKFLSSKAHLSENFGNFVSQFITPNTNRFISQTQAGNTNPGTNNTTNNIDLPDSAGVTSMLRRRCADARPFVRKAAIMALTDVVCIAGSDDLNVLNLDTMSERCMDVSVSVRKQAMLSLTDVLKCMHSNTAVQRCWLQTILTKLTDEDNNIQLKSVELLHDMVLSKITFGLPGVANNDSNNTDYVDIADATHDNIHKEASHSRAAWNMLKILSEEQNQNLRTYFSTACKQWHKQGCLPTNLYNIISSHFNTPHHNESWYLLSELVPLKVKQSHVTSCWNDQQPFSFEGNLISLENSFLGYLLKVISRSSTAFEATFISNVIDTLTNAVESFQVPIGSIAFFIMIILEIRERYCSNDAMQWPKNFFNQCHQQLLTLVYALHQPTKTTNLFEDANKIERCIFSYGHLMHQADPKDSLQLLVQFISESAVSKDMQSSQCTPLSQFHTVSGQVPNHIKSHVFIAIGKLCLVNAQAVKLCVPALVQQLQTSSDYRLRNNIVIMLCDLTVRYTLIVDPYMNCITSCLQDEHPLIRKQTFIMLTKLLQEDYIKWKGVMFFRLLRCAVDEEPQVKKTACLALRSVLNKKLENLYVQQFVESIFYFNAYYKSNTFNRQVENEEQEKKFVLPGKTNEAKRRELYEMMLQNMSDSHKFQCLQKMVNEVLLSFVDQLITLDDRSSDVMSDVLHCLSSKDIKLQVLKTSGTDEEDPHDDVIVAAQNVAKKRFVSQVMKKTVMEATVPVLVSLKQLLESRKSAMLRDLMKYFIILVKEYKPEVEAALATNLHLQKELSYAMKRFEMDEESWMKKRLQPVKEGSSSLSSLPVTPSLKNKKKKAMPLAVQAVINSARTVLSRSLLNVSNQSLNQSSNESSPKVTSNQNMPSCSSTDRSHASLQTSSPTNEHPLPDIKRLAHHSSNTPTHVTKGRCPMRAISTPADAGEQNTTNMSFAGNLSRIDPAMVIRGFNKLSVVEDE